MASVKISTDCFGRHNTRQCGPGVTICWLYNCYERCRMAPLALQWVFFMLLWLLFAFQFSVDELLVGALSSALAVIALQTAKTAVPLCFEPRLRWVWDSRSLPVLIANDLWTVVQDLSHRLRHKPSQGVWRQFHFETPNDCRGAAQRAFANILISMTPNSVVLDIDSSSSTVLFHELVAAPLPRYVRKLQK